MNSNSNRNKLLHTHTEGKLIFKGTDKRNRFEMILEEDENDKLSSKKLNAITSVEKIPLEENINTYKTKNTIQFQSKQNLLNNNKNKLTNGNMNKNKLQLPHIKFNKTFDIENIIDEADKFKNDPIIKKKLDDMMINILDIKNAINNKTIEREKVASAPIKDFENTKREFDIFSNSSQMIKRDAKSKDYVKDNRKKLAPLTNTKLSDFSKLCYKNY